MLPENQVGYVKDNHPAMKKGNAESSAGETSGRGLKTN